MNSYRKHRLGRVLFMVLLTWLIVSSCQPEARLSPTLPKSGQQIDKIYGFIAEQIVEFYHADTLIQVFDSIRLSEQFPPGIYSWQTPFSFGDTSQSYYLVFDRTEEAHLQQIQLPSTAVDFTFKSQTKVFIFPNDPRHSGHLAPIYPGGPESSVRYGRLLRELATHFPQFQNAKTQ